MFSADGSAPQGPGARLKVCKMTRNGGHMTERILSLTLEIIYLLTGEEYGPVKSSEKRTPKGDLQVSGGQERSRATISPPPPLMHDGILELTNKIIELLTGEDPGCAVSREEFAKEVKAEELRTSQSSDSDSSTAVTRSLTSSQHTECDLPVYYTKNGINIIQCDIDSLLEHEALRKIKVEEDPSDIDETKNVEDYFEATDNKTLPSHKDDKNVRLCSSKPKHTTYVKNPLDIAQIPGNASGDEDVCIEMEDTQLMSQQKTLAGKKPFVCCDCGKGFTRNTILVEHMRLHTGEKPYVCSICGQGFISNGQRIRHERLHSGEKPYKCAECGKGFTRNSILVEHKRIHTGEKPFPCSECGKFFTTNSQLVKHIKYHRGEKPHECQDCGKRFISNGLLVNHRRSHTGEKPFVCPHCSKAYARNAILQEHMRIHYGEKPFGCKECGKQFATNTDLRKHQRNHLGEKPHACPDCGKRFICNSLLVIHYRSHTGEKPFVCNECGKCFAKKGSLVSHHRIHTGNKPPRICPGI